MVPPSAAEFTLAQVLDIISEGVWDWNALTGRVERSPGWYRMLGYSVDSFNQDVLTWEIVIHPDDYPRVMAHFEDYINGRVAEYRIQYRCITVDGEELWIEDSGKIVEWCENGKAARMIGAHTNIHAAKMAQQQLQRQNRLLKGDNATLEQIIKERTDELAAVNQKLKDKMQLVEQMASYDVLTGVFNRRMFEQLLAIEINRATRYNQPLSVVLADIDCFKEVNDRFGHSVGDQVLSSVAHILHGHIREGDVLARWGGEEFAIILPNSSQEKAMEMTERLRSEIAEGRYEQNIAVTCSFGVTEFITGDGVNSLFARMDRALYQAKNNNRNNVQLL